MRQRFILISLFSIILVISLAISAIAKVTVTYWEKWTGIEAVAIERVVKAFNEKQDKIEVKYVPVRDYTTKLIAVFSAGETPPDVVGTQIFQVIDFAGKGLITPLDDYAKASKISRTTFLPGFWEGGVYQGRLYALPSTGHSWLMFYNKRLFKEAGLNPNSPPKTMNELNAANRKLTKKDPDGKIIQMGFNFKDAGTSWHIWRWPWWFGAELWDEKKQELIFDDKVLAAYEWMYNNAQEVGLKALQEFVGTFGEWGGPNTPFLKEKTAITFQGPWLSLHIRTYNPKMQVGAAAWPAVDEVVAKGPVVFVDSDTVWIPKGAKHPDEAWEFIKFLNSAEGQRILNCGEGGAERVPTVRNYGGSAFIKEHLSPFIKTHIDLMYSRNVKITPKIPVFLTYASEMAAAADDIYLKGDNPKERLEKAIKRAQEAIDKALGKKK